jgi:hypothetical protein
MVAAVSGCGTLSNKETRYFHDRDVINETVRSCFSRPYEGLSRSEPVSHLPNLDFPGKDHIRSYMHSRTGWCDMRGYQVVYRPVSTQPAGLPVDATKVLEYYFGGLAMTGFTCGAGKMTTTDSLQAVDKSWVNQDRTIFVTGQVVSDKAAGETLVSVFISEPFK